MPTPADRQSIDDVLEAKAAHDFELTTLQDEDTKGISFLDLTQAIQQGYGPGVQSSLRKYKKSSEPAQTA